MNPWKRKFYFYVSEVIFIEEIPVKLLDSDYTYLMKRTHTITRKLGFFSYHFIKFIHGEEKLIEMGSRKESKLTTTFKKEAANGNQMEK